MTSIEFENWLMKLSEEDRKIDLQARIARLNVEQQTIVQAREAQSEERLKLIAALSNPHADEEVHERVFNAMHEMDGDHCEHGRSYGKHCLACGAIDHLMYPELYDEDGFLIETE